jgi:hypothetical protein
LKFLIRRSLKTTKKAIADLRFGQFLEESHKKELLGELNVEPIPLRVLAKEFLDYVEANRSESTRARQELQPPEEPACGGGGSRRAEGDLICAPSCPDRDHGVAHSRIRHGFDGFKLKGACARLCWSCGSEFP